MKTRYKNFGWLIGALLFVALVSVLWEFSAELASLNWQMLGLGGAALATAPATVDLGEIKTLLVDSKSRIEKFTTDIEKRFTDKEAENKQLMTDVETIRKELDAFRKNQIAQKAARQVRPGNVSDDCARAISAICLLGADAFGGLKAYDTNVRERLVDVSREILGLNTKAALTSSDIPLPTDFAGEVVELVSDFGAARRYGTVYPLGTGQTKLPRLGTDPAFGLIAMSATVTEKSPTVVFVTFNAEKFGGLVRLPTEIDADSIVPMGQFLARYCARQMASIEDYNFFASTGAGSGINGSVAGLTSSTITNAKVTQMAATKTHYSDATLANLRAVRAVVDAPVLRTGAYYMHPSFEQHLSGLNTAGDKPYNPQAQIMGVGASGFATIGPTLDGFPIRWVDSLPAYSVAVNVSKVFILFGDPSYQYLGVRSGVNLETSREVFFATDELAVRCLERFTIGLMAVGSVSGLQTAAS